MKKGLKKTVIIAALFCLICNIAMALNYSSFNLENNLNGFEILKWVDCSIAFVAAVWLIYSFLTAITQSCDPQRPLQSQIGDLKRENAFLIEKINKILNEKQN